MEAERSLNEILQSASDVLFPDELGARIVEIGSRGTDGDTPLHVMAWRRDCRAIEVLIEAGAELDAIGDMGQTPLHVAVMQGDECSAELLLRAGASPDIRSEFGDTPRELAYSRGEAMERLFNCAAHRD